MSSMDSRKDAFEAKYAHDEEIAFKVEARASKFFGLWIAEQLGLVGADADTYAKEVVGANLEEPGFDDIMRKVIPDLEEKNIPFTNEELNKKMYGFVDQAKESIVKELDD